MVVQKIKFDFMQSKLDDIRVVQGDTCRDIEFEASDIHGEISPENYTFTFNLLKPDHTFVIVTLPSNILTITEQMWAITGTSYYCIRITDNNNELIYSGQGAFIVDDQVISDSDIESVAEVNGYVFPDDFATTEQIESVVESLGFAKIADNRQNLTETWSSEKIADYAGVMADRLIADNQIADDHTWSSSKIDYELTGKAMIDDETTSSVDTWSSSKIADELSEIEVLDVYSTTEKIVGKWIDNKTLYEKTFVLNNITGSGYYDTGVAYDTAFIKDGFVLLNDNTQMCPLNVFFDPNLFIWAIVERTGKIDYRLQPYTGTMNITIRYTKAN